MSNAQQTEAWQQDRLAKVTGTRCFDVVDVDPRGLPKNAYWKLLDQLIKEYTTGEVTRSFASAAMQHGTITEPIARVRFSLETGLHVREVPFINHPTIPFAGASLDGIIDKDNASIEIKCPQRTTHEKYLETGEIPPKYLVQMAWGLATIPKLTHCYFVSFNEEMPLEKQLLIKRVDRNTDFIERLEHKVKIFVGILQEKIAGVQDGRKTAA